MAEDGGWFCVQDPDLIANPRPRRLPTPFMALPPARPAEGIRDSGLDARPPAPVDAAPALPVETPPPPDSRPLYQQLAYQPEEAVSLVDLPGTYYAIQLVALESQEDLAAFVVDRGLPPMSGARVENGGRIFYVLLAGVYADRETGQRAMDSLPESLRAMDPWLRPMSSLREGIIRAERQESPAEP